MRSALSFSLDVPSSKSDVLSSIPLIADSAIKIEKVVGDNISPQYPLEKAGSSEPTFPDYFRTIKPLEIPVTVTFPTTAGLKPSGPLLMNSRTMHTNEKADPKVPIQQHYEKSTTKSTVTLLPTTVKIVIDESTPYPQPSMVQDPTYYPYKEGYMHDHGTEKLYSVDNTDLFSNYNDVVHMPGKLLKRIRKSSDSEFSKSFWRPLSTRHRGHNQATGIPILMHLFSPTVSEPTVPEKKKVKPIEKTQHTGFKGLANRMEIKSKTRYQQKTRTLFDVSRHLQIAKDRNTPAPRVALKRKKDLPHPKTGSYTFPQRTLKIPTSKITPIKEEVSPKKTQLHSHLGIQHRRERPTVTLDRRPTQTFGTRGRQASQSHPEIFGRGEQSGPKISPRRDKILRSVLPPVDNRLFSQRISFQQHATGRHVVPMESPRRGTTRKQINLRQLPKGPNYHAAPAQQPPSTGLLQKQTNRSKENSVQKVAPKIYIPGSDRITNTRDRKSDLYSKKKPKVSSALQVKEKTTKTNYQLSNKMTSSPIDFKQLTLDILRTIRPDVHLNELIKDSTTTATTTIQNGHIITKSKKGNNDITHVETRISNVSHPQFIQTPLQTSPLTTPIVTTWKSRNLNTRDRKLELNSKKKPKVSSALQVPQITAKTTKTISNKDNLKAKTINKVSVKAFHQTVEKSLPNGIIIYSEKPAIFTKTTTIKERQTASTPATHSVKQRTEVPYTTMKETTVLQKTNDQLSNKITSSSIDFKQLTLDILRTIRPDVHLDELLKDSTTTATTDIRNGYIITKSKKGNKDITQVETRISNVSHPEFTQTPLQTSPLTTPIVTTWQSTTEITPMTTPQTTTEIITTPQTTTEIITTPQTTTQSTTTPQTTTEITTTPQTTTEIITTPQTTTEIITTPQTTTQSTTTPQTTTKIVKNPQPTIKVVTTPQTTTQVVTTPQTITVTTTKTPKSTTVFSTPQTTTPVVTNPQTTTKVVTTPKLTTTTTTTSQVVTTQQVTKQVVTSPQTTLEVTTPPLIAVPVETILLSTTKATTTKNSPQALTSINSKMINPKTTPQVITSTEERRTPLVTTVKEAVPLSSTIHQLSPDFTTNRTSGHDTNEQGVYNSQMNSKSEVQLVRMTDPLTKTSFSKSPIFHQQDTRRISYISLPNPASSAMYKPVQPVASVIQTLSKKEIKSDRDIIRTYQSSLKPRLLLSPSLSRGVPSRKTNQPNVNGHQDRSRDGVLTQVNKRRNHPEDVSQSQLKKREQQSFRSNNQHIISNNTGQNSQQHQQQQRIQEQQLWKRRSKPQRNDQKPVLREFRFPVDTHSRTRIIRQHQTQHQTTTSRNQHQNVQPSRVGIPNLQQQQQIQQKHHQQQQVGTNPSQDKSSRNSQSSKYTNTAFITTTLPPVKQIKQFLQTFLESLDLHSTQSTEQHPNYTGLPQQRLNTQQLSMQSTRHSLPFSLQTRTVGPTHGSAVRPTSLHKQSQLQLPLQQNVHKKANFKRKRMESLSSSIKFAETNTNRALQQSPTVVTNKPQTTSRTRLRSMLPLFTKFHPSNLPSKNIIQVMPSRTTMLSTTTTDPPTTASSVSVKSLLMQLFKKEMRDSIKAIMPHQPTVTTERPTTTTVPITTTTSTSAPTTTTVKITTPASAESAAGQCGRGQTKKYHCEGRDMFYSMPSIVHWCIGMCFRGACIESVCSCNATCVLTPANSQEEALGSAISSALTGKSTDTGSIELALQSLLATLEFGTAASPTAASRFTSRPYTSTFAPTSSYISYEQFVSDRTTVSTTTKPTTTTVPSISGLLASIEKLIETKLRSMKPSTTKSPLLDAEGELIEAEDIPTTTTSTTVRHPPTQRRHPTSVPYSQLRYPNSHPSFQRRYPTSPPPTQRRYPTSPPSARHEQQSGWERRDQPAFHRRDHAPMWHDRGDQPKEHKDPWGRRSRPVERREWQDPWKDSPPRMTEPPPEQRWGEGGGVGRDGDGRGGDGRGGDGRGGGDQWGPREFIRRDGPPPRHLDTTPPPRAWQDNWRRDQGPRRDLGPPERGGWGGDRTTVDPLSQWGDRGFRRRRGRRFSRRSAFQGGEDAEPAD
ncbi:mucin-17-like isoform X2 [Mizuhopecten yessoensis]|uniref:mucin-17-like isoform X2 n=1 Tax=Mizuhopecten yessoensis TaxID=6573 RepID=UPI000B45C20C|nr:mucin-17-like isoform X2 [Mizuhopecten yessoensis]